MVVPKKSIYFANKIKNDIVFIFGKDTKIKRKTKNKSKKMIMTPILTDAQKRRTLRDATLYKEYLELTAIPENSRTGIMQLLMKKYEIGSTATYYAIINRKGGQQ